MWENGNEMTLKAASHLPGTNDSRLKLVTGIVQGH
jgi:hypothetical protein